MITSLKNGEHWKAPPMFLHEAITQWIEGDKWILLGVPEPGIHGWSVMNAFQDPDTHAIICSGVDIEKRLIKYGWKRVPPPAAIGDRVQYPVSSGFCTQAYEGVVIELGRDKALVRFDPCSRMSGTKWIEEEYLTVLGGDSK